MKLNESYLDRIIRAIVGVVLVYLGIGGALTGAVAIISIVVGVVLLATGAIGFCPIYWALKLKTLK